VVQLWVVAGPNGAGKTSLVTERLSARAILDEFDVVNPDVIAQALPRIDGRLDERQAGEIAVRRRNNALAARRSLAIETTLSGSSTLRFMRRARGAGYKINLIYVGIDSPELSLERVRARVADGGHDVPVTAIARRHPDSLAKLPEALSLSDRAYVLDNSGRRRRLVMIREAGRVRYLHPRAPGWFIQAAPAEFRKR
jgi:predicted ABC-type ATPase